MKSNKNAISGREIEKLFMRTVGKNPNVIEKLKIAFSVDGDFEGALSTGLHNEKCDVKLGFTSGRNMDANVKSYKNTKFNQATRMSVANFARKFGFSEEEERELLELVLSKTADRKAPLFPGETREKWKLIIQPKAKEIIKDAISSHPAREILVLYDKNERKMKIWKMRTVLTAVGDDVGFTPKGNITLGTCFVLQRKGGNGMRVNVPKDDPKHPGNDIQIKLDVAKFLSKHETILLCKYTA